MEFNKSPSELSNSIFEGQFFRKATPEYLQELLQDKQKLQCFQPNFHFRHLLNILEKEINRVREKLFHINGTSGHNKSLENSLPSPKGEYVTLQDKVFLPVDENPNYNFIGRILGPRGLTAKQLEQELQCKLMIRGKGSLRNKEKEDELRGKPNWEHLNDRLHINVTVEDYENRASLKLKWAKEAIEKFIEHGIKVPDGEDDIKKRQLMELAIINGTYRDTSKKPHPVSTAAVSNNSSDVKSSSSFKYSSNSVLPYVSTISTSLPQNGQDTALLGILPSVNSSTLPQCLNPSSNSVLPIYDANLMNILTPFRASFDTFLPLANFSGLFGVQDVNVGTNNLIGPIRVRNLSSSFRSHPYQMMGNI